MEAALLDQSGELVTREFDDSGRRWTTAVERAELTDMVEESLRDGAYVSEVLDLVDAEFRVDPSGDDYILLDVTLKVSTAALDDRMIGVVERLRATGPARISH